MPDVKSEKNILETYDRIFEKTILQIEGISKDTGMHDDELFSSCRSILNDSSCILKKKWETGRKYARTSFVERALGSSYPDEYAEISVCVDSIINLLDDLFDERLDSLTRSLSIVEVGRNLAFLNRHENYTENISSLFGEYLCKIVFMGLTEGILREYLRKTSDEEEFFRMSSYAYLARSMDIDFFVQIADMSLLGEARCFRVLNLMKKDIDDIEHDMENGKDTPVTILYRRDKNALRKFLTFSIEEYADKTEGMKSGFGHMCSGESVSIKERLEKI